MKTLNDQHRLIKEGKGHKGVFLKEAKAQFPQWIRNAATFKETASILKNKGIINENVVGLEPINQLVSPPKQSYEVAFENYLEEAKKKDTADAKAEEKETSKQVKDAESKNFDRKNMENPDNLIFDQIMTGYYYELKNPKNSKKTVDELKSIVFKNLAKNPIYYTEKGQFGEEIGYETEAPGLGKGRQVKNVGIGGGYGTPTKKKFPEGEVGTGYLEVPKKIKGSGLKVKNVTTLNENKLKESYEEYEEKKYAEDLALRYRSRGDWPDDISEEEFRDLMGKYDLKLYDDDNFTDPAGGSGLASHLEESHQPGDKVIYKGTKYEVVDEDEFIITLKDEEGNITKQNYNQFKKGEYKPDLQESKLREVINTLIREEFEGEGLDPNTLHNNKGHWTIPNKHIDNPQDISDYIEAVDGMSKAEAIDYLGDQGLSSSQVLKIVSKINYDIRDIFNQDPDVRIDRSDDLYENKLRKVVNTLVKQQIQENVQKELLQITKDAEYEVIASKIERVAAAIDKRQSQLDRLDEDEDLKNLTDKKKLKALGKDIKVLEKAKAKMEKELAKKDKSSNPQPEMIDGDEEIIDEAGMDDEIVDDFIEEDLIDEADGDSQDMEDMAAKAKELSSEMDKISKMELFEEEPED